MPHSGAPMLSQSSLAATTAASTAKAAGPQLHKAYVAADGRIKALFSDNSLILLSATAEAFVHVSSGGAQTRQLCNYALRRFWPQLSQALAFRNLHQDTPMYPKPLLQALSPGQLFTVGYAIPDVDWPHDAEEALHMGLVEFQEDGRTAVRSRCNTARVVLEQHRLRFAVCYPLLVSHEGIANTYTYSWQTQVFSASQHPVRWAPALAAAVAVADSQAAGFRLQSPSCRLGSGHRSSKVQLRGSWHAGGAGSDAAGWLASCRGSYGRLSVATSSIGRLLWDGAGSARHSIDVLRHSSGERGSSGGIYSSGTSISCISSQLGAALGSCFGAKDGWWFEPSPLLPCDEVIVMEWSQEATFVWLQGSEEVEVWLHADDSCMASTSCGRFMQHWVPGEQDPRVYAAAAVPDHITSMASAQRLEVGLVVARALKLRNAMASSAAHARSTAARPAQSAPRTSGAAPAAASCDRALSDISNTTAAQASSPSSTTWQQQQQREQEEQQAAEVCNAVVEEQWVAGTGHFVAYADGRVKCVFADRTILHMSAHHDVVRLVLHDGSRATVAVANPVGVEHYVAAAVEFAAWGFKTPAERAQALRMQALIQAELQSSERMATICAWASSKTVPPAAAASRGRLPWECAGGDDISGSFQGISISHSTEKEPTAVAQQDGTCSAESSREEVVLDHSAAGVPMTRHEREQQVEQLLKRNTELLQRLCAS